MKREAERLEQDRLGLMPWKRWGPYLAERAWGTVREDYSVNGDAWGSFPHDQARSRAYRWNEDGLLGLCDDHGRLCLALALWNGQDPIIKERFFGLSGPEGNHGEDVKEAYFFLDGTPTHAYFKALYKYPQTAFPYETLRLENQKRGKLEPEFELHDTGVFAHGYWDVEVEYAKAGPEDILMRVTAHNRSANVASLHVLPHLWFRNTWSWGEKTERHRIVRQSNTSAKATHPQLGERFLYAETGRLLFCENETNLTRLYGLPNASASAKDGINDAVVHGATEATNAFEGSKMALHQTIEVPAGQSQTLRVRFCDNQLEQPFVDFDAVFAARQQECDEFYEALQPSTHSGDARLVQRQAYAGLLWSKQHYHYDVARWLSGDARQVAPPNTRLFGRNHEWETFNSNDVISMPDTWEYPWFAAWDLAFHAIPLAHLDPAFAKAQLLLLTREWFQHPNGQLPAYEWNFSDVNPPVHAWAALRVYQIEQQHTGRQDRAFLERVFHKLLLYFNWWVNRKDEDGHNVFQGGFLGLDNISVFDRSHNLPTGGKLEQSDGTAWMGFFALSMLKIALELARENPVYEDIASKFFEHFLYIARALENAGLWDDKDGFYYDAVRDPNGQVDRLEVRSLVGLIPLLAVTVLDAEDLKHFPAFNARLEWFLKHRPELADLVSENHAAQDERRLLSLVRGERLRKLLAKMLDEQEFLSAHGVRSLSKFHLENPFAIRVADQIFSIGYEAGEGKTGMFGGNSNWRGPVWMPINALLIEALEALYTHHGNGFCVQCPTGSGQEKNLLEVANDLKARLCALFVRDPNGRRAVFGDNQTAQFDPHWQDLVLFYEYFHGDTGAGLGAAHQTGWTGLVASIMQETKTT